MEFKDQTILYSKHEVETLRQNLEEVQQELIKAKIMSLKLQKAKFEDKDQMNSFKEQIKDQILHKKNEIISANEMKIDNLT